MKIFMLCLFIALSFCSSSGVRAEDPAPSSEAFVVPVTDEVAPLKEKLGAKGADYAQTLEELVDLYFQNNDYDGLYAYLSGLAAGVYADAPEVYFYMAYSRIAQMDFWKKTKNWEGLFDKAAAYKETIAQDLDRAEELSKDDDRMLLGIKYMRWQAFREDDQDRAAVLFSDLLDAARKSAPSAPNLEMLKQVADDLARLQDKALSRRVYEVFVEKLTSSDVPTGDLKSAAEGYLKEGNVYLAKSLFDAYLGRFGEDAAGQAGEMAQIADQFADTGGSEGLDPVFSEEMYAKAEAAAPDALDAASQYRRALNLGRLKEYRRAFDEYKKLTERFPDYEKNASVYFRMGALSAYAFADVAQAKTLFSKIIDALPNSAVEGPALYQLGLLNQWEGDKVAAAKYYELLVARTCEECAPGSKDLLAEAGRERLDEIAQDKEMRYGLRLFLEQALKVRKDDAGVPSGSFLSVDLVGRPAKQTPAAPVTLAVTTSSPSTGCMMPVYSYEWSGDLGSLTNVPNSPEVTLEYPHPGMKVVQVVVIGPDGPQGAGFDILEIGPKE